MHVHVVDRDQSGFDSPIRRWHPRYKIVGLFSLILSFATARSLLAAVLAGAIAAGMYGWSGLSWSVWRSRVAYPGWFVVALVAVLPFVAGTTPWFALGPLTVYQEGCTTAAIAIVRFLSILTLAACLVDTTPWLDLVRALRGLGLSPVLTDMLLLSYRYLADVRDCWQRMVAASTLRGFNWQRLDRRRLGQLAALVGTLLIRSHDRSQRVYQAMRLRGYGLGRRTARDDRPAGRRDRLLTAAAAIVAIGFAIAQIQP